MRCPRSSLRTGARLLLLLVLLVATATAALLLLLLPLAILQHLLVHPPELDMPSCLSGPLLPC